MQTDMHYYGTYAMARAAGLNKQTCKKIAFSAQFVDDNVDHIELPSDDGTCLSVTATSRHLATRSHLDEREQVLICIPFHFLPGATGESHEGRLICRKNSAVAQGMFEHYLSMPSCDFTPYLFGIAAHVYANTFSHYGFSGISSEACETDRESFEFKDNLTGEIRDYRPNNLNSFWAQLAENTAKRISDGLDHSAALIYADRPSLIWRFVCESGKKSDWRDNPQNFLEACEKLHYQFQRFAHNNHEYRESEGVAFDAIKDVVVSILSIQKKMPERIDAWQEFAKSGKLFGKEEAIPKYGARIWQDKIDNESTGLSFRESNGDLFNFLKAADLHRTYVLSELLPKHGLLVV